MKIIRATVLAVLMAGILAVPVVSAHGTQQSRPKIANTCQWINSSYWNSQDKIFYDGGGTAHVELQGILELLVNTSNGDSYCGEVQARATDSLFGSPCATFDGYVRVVTAGIGHDVSLFNIYHCSALTYNFSGAMTSIACPSGSSMQVVNYEVEYQDYVYGPTFYC